MRQHHAQAAVLRKPSGTQSAGMILASCTKASATACRPSLITATSPAERADPVTYVLDLFGRTLRQIKAVAVHSNDRPDIVR